jgi:uncharacterized protein YodC (DUF2158 family)
MSLAAEKTKQFERRAIIAALSWLCDPLRTMENLKTGDVVQLKSGGPIMTIRKIDGEWVTCDWFDDDGKANQKQFTHPQLKAAEASSGPYIA